MSKLPAHPMQPETRKTLNSVLDILAKFPRCTVSAAFDSIPDDNLFKGAAILYTLLASHTQEWSIVGTMSGLMATETIARAIRMGDEVGAI